MPDVLSYQSMPSRSTEKNFSTSGRGGAGIFSAIVKILIAVAVIVLVVQAITITKALFARYPGQKICWQESMCKSYCLYDWKPTCEAPAQTVTVKTWERIKSAATGQSTVFEAVSSKQKFCACNDTSPAEKSREELYDFYIQNK